MSPKLKIFRPRIKVFKTENLFFVVSRAALQFETNTGSLILRQLYVMLQGHHDPQNFMNILFLVPTSRNFQNFDKTRLFLESRGLVDSVLS